MPENSSTKKSSRFPVWLSTLSVIVMIILFSLMINQAGERESAEQHSNQSLALAKSTAAGIEYLFDSVEKKMILLCNNGAGHSHATMEIFQRNMDNAVQFIAKQDATGRITDICPSSPHSNTLDSILKAPEFLQLGEDIKKSGKISVSGPIDAACETVDTKTEACHVVLIGVPIIDQQSRYSGMAFAALSLTFIVERYMGRSANELTFDALLADDKGHIITRHGKDASESGIGETTYEKSKNGTSLKKALLEGKAGYGEFYLPGINGKPVKTIAAFAPIMIDDKKWSVVIATPYRTAISHIKKTFYIVMLEALLLITTVVIGSALIIVSGKRRLLLEEELKLLQERNKWREQLLTAVEETIEASPIPTFVVNKEHKVLFWNKACTELTGLNGKDMIGTENQYKPFYSEKRPVIADLIIDNDIEKLTTYYSKKRIHKSAVVEGAYEASDYFENLGGKSRYLYFLATPIYNEEGEIIAAIETIQDVTKQEEMARKLRENAESLSNEICESVKLRHDLEELYDHIQSILDSLPDRLVTVTTDGIINYVSNKFASEIKLTPQQMQGRHFIEFVAPEYRALMTHKWEKEVKMGIHKPFEITARAKDGSKQYLLITSARMIGTDQYLIMQRNITDYKNLETKFYESQKLAAVGQLSAGIAHEVRNPLSSIKMSLQILEKRLKPEGNDLKRFNIASKEVEHLEKIVNDILIYAKPTLPEMKPTDIASFLESSLMMVEKDISEKKINTRCDVAPGIPRINMDSSMLMHAFLNIYLNAIDAMEIGGHLSVTVGLVQDGERLIRIEVTDDGCGIDEGDITQLFNPFFTRKRYGTGLGLTHVKKFVDLHHGNIEIASKKGEGTKVIVTLPLEEKKGSAENRQ
jgi:two-component system, NtrC family, sensor kinase